MIEIRWLIRKEKTATQIGHLLQEGEICYPAVLQYRQLTTNRVADFLPSFWSEWKEVPTVYESDEKVLATEKKS